MLLMVKMKCILQLDRTTKIISEISIVFGNRTWHKCLQTFWLHPHYKYHPENKKNKVLLKVEHIYNIQEMCFPYLFVC